MNIILHDFEIQNLFKNGRGQIRRAIPIKFLPGYNPEWTGYKPIFEYGRFFLAGSRGEPATKEIKCPFGAVGEEIWVKETWQTGYRGNEDEKGDAILEYLFKASGDDISCEFSNGSWYSPVYMPREASRLTIIPERIWTEPLQAITKDGLLAEGAETDEYLDFVEWANSVAPPASHIETPKEYFAKLWDLHNRKSEFDPNRWDANPMVFVGEMRVK